MIDFHVHIFPDNMAVDTVEVLAETAGIDHHSDGTVGSLFAGMHKTGVTHAVNLPVATKPEQVHGINRWIIAQRKKHPWLVSFGAMHPLYPHPREEIAFLKENGVQGIKLHPEYQNFYPDDAHCAAMYEACRAYGLIVHFHAGVDLAYADCHGCPERFVSVLGIPGLKVVLAHMGGYRMWDAVEKYLVGKPVYFDTSVSYEMGAHHMRRMIQAHGPDRILFGTDSPWDYADRMKKFIETLNLGKAAEHEIFTANAASLLGLHAPFVVPR
ncbi:MAG: amidohydrolase family protein [Elusimicrobia bacterium]|nr:amidohydrolase family protein [Elusimicrobiota bacterium]